MNYKASSYGDDIIPWLNLYLLRSYLIIIVYIYDPRSYLHLYVIVIKSDREDMIIYVLVSDFIITPIVLVI